MAAVITIAEVVPFAPQSELGKRVVAAALENFVDSPEGLRYLVSQACQFESRWQGVIRLREIYCERFHPADGRLPTADPQRGSRHQLAAAEREYFEREARETENRIARYRAERQLQGPEDAELTRQALEACAMLERRFRRPLPGPVRLHATPTRTPEERQKIATQILTVIQRRGQA